MILFPASWNNRGPPKKNTHVPTAANFLANQRYPQEVAIVLLSAFSQECVSVCVRASMSVCSDLSHQTCHRDVTLQMHAERQTIPVAGKHRLLLWKVKAAADTRGKIQTNQRDEEVTLTFHIALQAECVHALPPVVGLCVYACV